MDSSNTPNQFTSDAGSHQPHTPQQQRVESQTLTPTAISAESQAQQPQTQDVEMHIDGYDTMPGLESLSPSPNHTHEVEMMVFHNEPVPSAFTSYRSLSALPPRTSSRRPRVEDDEDDERDRRHPSERVSTPSRPDSTAAGPSQASAAPPTPSQSLRERLLSALPRSHFQPIPTNNNSPATTLFQSLFFGNPINAPGNQVTRQQANNDPSNGANASPAPTDPINPPQQPQPQPQQPPNAGLPRLPPFMAGNGIIDIQIGAEVVIDLLEHDPVEGPRTADGQPPVPPQGDQARSGIFDEHLRSINQMLPGADVDVGGLPTIFDLANLFEFRNLQEKEDPERAKKLVDGLEVVPVGLVRRLERVGGAAGPAGEELVNGGDAGCAICWDKLLDGDGEGFGEKKEDEHKDPGETEAEASSDDTDTSSSSSADESNYPKIVSLPCAHVFHADCLIPWFSRPKHTTCPTCRFNIDPDNLTYNPPQSQTRPTTARGPNTAAPTEGDQPNIPEAEQITNNAEDAPQLNPNTATGAAGAGAANLPPTLGAAFRAWLQRYNDTAVFPPAQADQQPQPQQQPNTWNAPATEPNPASPSDAPTQPRFRPPRISVSIIPIVLPPLGQGVPRPPAFGPGPAPPQQTAHAQDSRGPPSAPHSEGGNTTASTSAGTPPLPTAAVGNEASGSDRAQGPLPQQTAAAATDGTPPRLPLPRPPMIHAIPMNPPPAIHMFGDLFRGPRRPPPPKGPWVLPPAPGPTLRQRIERREREAGLRCHDVSCGIGPSDEDPFGTGSSDVTDATALMKQLSIKSKDDGKSELCMHRFHSPCLVSAERVALKGADAIVEGGNVEVSCPVCRHVGCVSKEEWDEGVVALS